MGHGLERERERLRETREKTRNWRRWGPYLSERQWGTVREDYSPDGDAWSFFPHDQARSRAYRWGEDGLLGLCDESCYLCFALALWNGQDAILKERLFGLANPEGNHGEDVKECYYYLDALPTSSYLRALYKYPQRAYPYDELVAENRRRGKHDPEYELLDTGMFDDGRYFDVYVEYAKDAPDDVCILLTLINRGPEAAPLHVLPTLWFRNTWSWQGGYELRLGRPSLEELDPHTILAEHTELGRYLLSAGAGPGGRAPSWLFTENETNGARLFGERGGTRFAKDAFHARLLEGRTDAVNPARRGTKAAAWYELELEPGASVELRLRLSAERHKTPDPVGREHGQVLSTRRRDCEDFYRDFARPRDEPIVRQAAAGLIWSQQFYYYAVRDWLEGDPVFPPPAQRLGGRNADWQHVFARNVISMPDKWEFPWFAAWDLAFHMLPFGLIDPDFAREQLLLMTREWYMHPNGQLAAYEYNFADVNPPVHAWACMHLFARQRPAEEPDRDFLIRVFNKLLLNFTWWVNRKDSAGRNLFGGGFLGLDNIGVFDRSMPLPEGMVLEQADGTAWMGMFCSSMLSMALSLAQKEPAYEDIAVKFLEHFVSICNALNTVGGSGLWDEEDGFYYDRVVTPHGSVPLKVRSMVGLLPMVGALYAEGIFEQRMPEFGRRVRWAAENVPGMRERLLMREVTDKDGRPQRKWLLCLPTRERLERMLRVMLDEGELLSPYGIRALSRYHLEHPFVLDTKSQRLTITYQPGESDSFMFGGNSNWRGPIWFPLNSLIIESLMTYHRFYGDGLKVEYPTHSGNWVNLREVALGLTDRLLNIFRRGPDGARPVHGKERRYADDPAFRDLILFYEYFHGDHGAGCGASHQTGWTALAMVAAHVLHLADEGQR